MLLGRVVFEGRALLSNQLSGLHWRKAGLLRRGWRERACDLWGRELAGLGVGGWSVPVEVWSGVVLKGVLPDCGAWFPSVEGAVNGLVDVGGLPDDTAEWVRRVVFEAPCRPGPEEVEHVWVEIREFDLGVC